MISKEEFEQKEKNREAIYTGYIRNRKVAFVHCGIDCPLTELVFILVLHVTTDNDGSLILPKITFPFFAIINFSF